MYNSRMLRALYYIGVVAIPFDAVPGFAPFGELGPEASFYPFFLALIYAAMLAIGGVLERSYRHAIGTHWVMVCTIALVASVALSCFFNLSDMIGASFHDRGGLPKFATSAGVVVYGFALAWLTTAIVGEFRYERLIIPVSISATICLVVSIFEQASLGGLPVPPFQAFYSFIHSGTEGPALLWDGSLNLKVLEGWDKRLRSVSFEPPAFGNFAGLVWPWLAYGVVTSPKSRRALHAVLLAAFTVLIVVAKARTGWLLLAADIGTFALLWFVFLPPDGRTSSLRITGVAACGVAGMLAAGSYYAVSYDRIVSAVVTGDSVSDLTRLAYQVTALKMFAANPVFGVGLGQFAFAAADFMPSWGFRSAEIPPSLVFPAAPWPNTYSLYARIAAELGIVGLIVWIRMWVWTAVCVYRAGLGIARSDGGVSWVCYAILMSIAAILVSGFTTDTFRTPLIWITLGMAARIIGRARERSGLSYDSPLNTASIPLPDMTVRHDIGRGSSAALSGQSS